MKLYYVYIIASSRNGTLYIGVTSDLLHRVWQHREGILEGFTKRYGVKRLVHYEIFETINAALARETALKKWRRQWKIDLIQKNNVEWDDLYDRLLGAQPSPDWLVQANAVVSERKQG